MAMLFLVHRFFKGRIIAAHLDHCTREGASHRDAEFVRKICAEWNIECKVKTVDIEKTKHNGESFEMAGRRVRYEHFYDTAHKADAPFIAVAHNSDDVVETQLLNLARGSGIAGLRGIPETNGVIVRPVIDFTREELRTLLRENDIPWCEDCTNSENDYTRNKVRNILIPWIKENLNPSFENVMLGLAREASAETEAITARAAEEIQKISFTLPPAMAAWRVNRDVSRFVLAEMLRLQGKKLNLPVLSRRRTEELIALIMRSGRNGDAWRFQWALDVEVCCSERGIGWLRRGDIEKIRGKSREKRIKIADNGKNLLPWWARQQ